MSDMKIENDLELNEETFVQEEMPRKANPKRKYIIALVLVFLICSICAVLQMAGSRSVAITINSASVAKGQNPDGSPFDIYQMLSGEVLEMASEKLGGKISAAELKEHLMVTDALSNDTNQQIHQSILDGQNENTAFPTVYCVTCVKVSDAVKAEGIGPQVWETFTGWTVSEMDMILEAVVESYQEFYAASYLDYAEMFKIDWETVDTMDCYNRAEALQKEAFRIQSFLQDKATANPGSASTELNFSYGDLNNDLWQLIQVDIENHKAFIIQNSVTTSRAELLRQFSYMEAIYKEEMVRKTEEYRILDEAVDMYDSSTTKVVFIPALDQNDSFYMNRTKIGLDYLVEKADAARLAADEAEHNAQYYQYLQLCFADATELEESKIAHADAIYLELKAKLIAMNESTQMLLEETNQTDSEGIKAGNISMSAGILSVGLSFAKRFVLLSMAAYILICIPSFFPKKKQEESQEV